ncbi:D-alanyl-D-alanine carboxypeptidase/D-alanyl-D-alanine-endopeptidase [Sinirhodobacter sp. WL0062]|uniref:D-alanyl-D-alanine carboxypeptidase/D-alanyl-D-alanine-endopeptidase n=1 Tax=Rhodobacter flavimaris TaxID=2907145 RepID=A0ABS8Z0X3_9RHOB|nr:D-alanyl-D-alanine carboxypeptidase/D-alanyl-D-alanine-endopeptidase [Sinirhodobacter sp. WL0062]MCE5975190.1 D-alanyl-D-alanine carboxypeptidase/D-alanyl-D-alanine-endopeptidase [Sinirhodobacter sp. WL0062]
MQFSRRQMIFGAGALACAIPRGSWAAGGADGLIGGLSGDVSYVVADLASGKKLEARGAEKAMPPASTVKAITSLYALEALGGGYRFATRLIATGPISGGVLQGDLVLAGGGDPTLTTDDLGDMAARLAAIGLRGVSGRFLVWGGALPYAPEIAGDQPIHVGYNPAISGLILNFNRVHFEWRRAGQGWQVGMDARGERFQPKAFTAEVALANRKSPLFTYANSGGKEHWTVAASGLNKHGSRWLPVRNPDAYAGDVFQTLARAQGIALPAPGSVRDLPGGTVLVEHRSEQLGTILRGMMKYSTNVTAEAVGMTTSVARGMPAARGQSGASMGQWLASRLGGSGGQFADHSGLGAETRVSAQEMVRALAQLGPAMGLRDLMKGFDLRDDAGRKIQNQTLDIAAKTGTLNFASSLAGYMTGRNGRQLVFAIMTADMNQRRRTAGQETPAGSREWIRRSKILQSRLLERWSAL